MLWINQCSSLTLSLGKPDILKYFHVNDNGDDDDNDDKIYK